MLSIPPLTLTSPKYWKSVLIETKKYIIFLELQIKSPKSKKIIYFRVSLVANSLLLIDFTVQDLDWTQAIR